MNILRFGSHLLSRASPVGIILGGTALALTVPPLRRGLRTVAVVATRGVLSIADEAKRVTAVSRENMESIINEAKDPDTCCPSCADFTESVTDLKTGPHRLAVAATMGALTVSDKAKSLYKDASQKMKNIVDEAKNNNLSPDPSETDIEEDTIKETASTDNDIPEKKIKMTVSKEKDLPEKKIKVTASSHHGSESDDLNLSKHQPK